MPRPLLRLLLLLVPLMVLGPALLPGSRLGGPPVGAAGGAGALPHDLVDAFAMRRAVESGSLPTWEPRFGLGAPLAASSELGAWYPPNLLYLAVEPEHARGWLAFFALVVGGLGLALLGQRLGLAPLNALAGCAAYQLLAVHLAVEGRALLDGAVWLPWCFWAQAGLIREEPARGSGPALALCLGLLWLAAPAPLGSGATAALLGRLVTVQGARARALRWLTLGVLLGAVRWVPWLDLFRHGGSDRAVGFAALGFDVGTFALPWSAFGFAFPILAIVSLLGRRNGIWLALLLPIAVLSGLGELVPVLFGWLVAAGAETVMRFRSTLPFRIVVAMLVAVGIAEGVAHGPDTVAELPWVSATPVTDALARAAQDGRVLRFGGPAHPGPGLVTAHGIADLDARRALGTRRSAELLGLLDLARGGGALVDHPLLDLFRARAVSSTAPLEHRRLSPVLELRDGLCVYARDELLGPVRVVPQLVAVDDDQAVLGTLRAATIGSGAALVTARPATIALPAGTEFVPGELTVRRPAQHRVDVGVTGSSGGWLVFHEAWSPGWKATVDGADAEVRRVDHAFRAVRIPAGDSVVRTKYEPWSLRIGASVSVLALFASGFLARRARSGPPGAVRSSDALPGPLQR